MEDFDHRALHLCPHAKAAQLTPRCASGGWYVWSEVSLKGQKGRSPLNCADPSCAPLALFCSWLTHDAALWDSACSLHLFPGLLWSHRSSKDWIKAATGRRSKGGVVALQLLCPAMDDLPHSFAPLGMVEYALIFHPFWTHYHLKSVTPVQINTWSLFLTKRKHTRWAFRKINSHDKATDIKKREKETHDDYRVQLSQRSRRSGSQPLFHEAASAPRIRWLSSW